MQDVLGMELVLYHFLLKCSGMLLMEELRTKFITFLFKLCKNEKSKLIEVIYILIILVPNSYKMLEEKCRINQSHLKDEAMMVKCHDQDLNPHSAIQIQSLLKPAWPGHSFHEGGRSLLNQALDYTLNRRSIKTKIQLQMKTHDNSEREDEK